MTRGDVLTGSLLVHIIAMLLELVGSTDKEPVMSSQSWSAERTLAAFDEHLRRVRGLSAGTRRNYARFVGEFLEGVFPQGVVEFGRITTGDVMCFRNFGR